METARRRSEFLENAVLVVIGLVLVQTFLEDYAVLAGWGRTARVALMVAGFFFDLFFTVEFLIRAVNAAAWGRFGEYFTRERGWIDLAASIPLLLFNSGPTALALLAGANSLVAVGGMLNVLKVVKAIRVARVLRLLRVLKIVKKVKHTDSVMAQRHVARITATSVTTFVVGLMLFSLLSSVVVVPGLDRDVRNRTLRVGTYLEQAELLLPGRSEDLTTYAQLDDSLLLVRVGGETRFSRYDDATYRSQFAPGDYGYVVDDDVELYFDLRPLTREASRNNIVYFFLIVLTVLVFMVVYTPHFAMTVSDPVHIMRRGMEEPSYNLEIRVPRDYRDDEVYALARRYNETFLPLKARNADQEGAGTSLKLDDVLKGLDE